ncbi:MAG: hypothetical protein HQK64_08810 [Desulfamplus sp.]|nr:hypothetical protein [Desulfamplus sp.]
MESLFIKGLMGEERESLSSQLGLWHHLTLRNILQRKFTGWIAKDDHLGNFLHDKAQMASKSDMLSLKLWKLNEIMRFLNIPQPEKFEPNSLNAVGMEIEVQATALLRRIDKDFRGTSPDDMVRHLLIKIIENLSEDLKQKDIKTQDEIIQKVLEILEAMPEDQQKALKRLLSVEKFTSDIIRTAIFDHSLSTALASFMLMVKYTIYYEIAKIALVLSGALTLYVAKPYVRPLLPLIFFIFSPFGVAAIGLGLTWWTDFYTNRQIQSFLLPVMVMSSILASVEATKEVNNLQKSQRIELFIDFYNNQGYNNRIV